MRLPFWLKRLVLAYQFRCWPWLIPDAVVRYISVDTRISQADIDATERFIKSLTEQPRRGR